MKVAIIQLTSVLDPQINLKKIDGFIQKAKNEGAYAIFLPEVFYSISDGTKPTPYLIEDENEHYKNIQNLAVKNQVYLIGGSAATKVNDKVMNRTYNFSPTGKALENYDKMNLFAVDLSRDSSKTVINESDVYTRGSTPKILDLGDWKVGLGICFDVRFPEVFRNYARSGANILTVASAFTRPTGAAHWHTLVRARAIENQSYVIASAQVGEHNERIKTYGHSLIVDPWGEVLVDAKEEEGAFVVDLSLERVQEIRSRMKVF